MANKITRAADRRAERAASKLARIGGYTQEPDPDWDDPIDVVRARNGGHYIPKIDESEAWAPTEKRIAYQGTVATPRQVEFLMSLYDAITPGNPGRSEALGRATRMTKAEASALIDKLIPRAKEARAKRTAAQPDLPAGVRDLVPEGHYAIPSTGTNDLAFYRVDRPTEGRWAGRVFVKLVIGGHPDTPVPYKSIAGILERIAADPDAGPRYGREIGRCYVCNRHLTDEESRAAGIGPVCRT